jgi:hypothetical protein
MLKRFKCLESIVQNNGSSDSETEKRISKIKVISMPNSTLRRKNVLRETKKLIYKTILKSMLAYEADTWA